MRACSPGLHQRVLADCDRRLTPHAVAALGLRLKKVARTAEQDRPDAKGQRDSWRESQPWVAPRRLVFLDEIWASTDMARRYGRVPQGQRLVEPLPHGH